jgi:Spy/CpxP family protein refolding chaperone
MAASPGEEGFGPGGGFGVRRPLRFLAYKLDLDEKQVILLARILDELKTERAQAAVDDRRALADFADALAGEQFDGAKAAGAGERRVESTKRLSGTLVRALGQIHAMLNPEQREHLAHLIRAGILAV